MNNFNEEYSILSKLYKSVLNGNEIEFQYDKKNYYILPNYENNKVVGVCIGEAYTENEKICFSETELYNTCIGNIILGKVISQINIVWTNF